MCPCTVGGILSWLSERVMPPDLVYTSIAVTSADFEEHSIC
jgi:hypothetical protein